MVPSARFVPRKFLRSMQLRLGLVNLVELTRIGVGKRVRRRAARRAWALDRGEVLAVLALGVLVLATYWPVTQAGFVWDDSAFVDAWPVQDWGGLRDIWLAPEKIVSEVHYWPVLYTSYWLEHKLYGYNALGFHLVNLALHLVNTLLLWRLLPRLAARVPPASSTPQSALTHRAVPWLAAALFAIHPVHAEAVAWLIARKDLLMTLFYLCAVMTWLNFLATPPGMARVGRYALALVLFAASMLSKSMAVTLPAALLLWHFWRRGAIIWMDVARLAPFFALGVALGLGDKVYYEGREAMAIGFDYSVLDRVTLAAQTLWFYVGKLVWPTDLVVVYPHWVVDATRLMGWIAVAAASAVVAALWIWRARIGRGPLVAVLLFGLTLAPVLGFVDFGYMQFSFAADRYQYLACAGLFALVAAGGVRGVELVRARLDDGGSARLATATVRTSQGLAALALTTLGALSFQQTALWRDPLTLFSHIVAGNPNAQGAHANLAPALVGAGRAEEGLEAALIAVERAPNVAITRNNLGAAYMALDRADEALAQVLIAIRADNGNAELRANAGKALLKLERPAEAEAQLRAGLVIDQRAPGIIKALEHLAVMWFERERFDKALGVYRTLVELRPEVDRHHANLGKTLYMLGRYEEAGPPMRRGLDLAGDAATATDTAQLNLLLGHAARAADRLGEAANHYEAVLAIDPRHVEALGHLALLRFGQARYRDAMALYRTLTEVNPDSPTNHANLGAVLLQLGEHEQGIANLERALALDSGNEQARANLRRARSKTPALAARGRNDF